MSKYFYKNPKAPVPTRLHIGTTVAIYHEDRVLLDHRRDGEWGLIGGALDPGESLEECARREIMEETGLSVGSVNLLGLFSHPSRIIEFANGEVVQSVTICFAAEAATRAIRLSAESRNARFCTQDELQNLSIAATHRMIIPYLFRRETWPVIS
ncbi:MAG: hypothetical protein A2X28_04640 [Elusimicrobia bacterium GWA2_56_46]|nr:MAG: hypothetical protein A2X28_04640 [Elusimicrobia bacterium GWA2_56_46]OGR56163.1 MAG: hypothetical protein A2X39_08060 [Elusimicrobia bacterium GWC2_56_31]